MPDSEHPVSPGAQAVATAIQEAGNGLKGWGKTVANMTAVGVALVLVVATFWFFMDQAKEDRKATRDYLQQLQADHKSDVKDLREDAKSAVRDAKEAALAASKDQKEAAAIIAGAQKDRSKEIEVTHNKTFDALGVKLDKLIMAQEETTKAIQKKNEDEETTSR